jgi:hypothetical protein
VTCGSRRSDVPLGSVRPGRPPVLNLLMVSGYPRFVLARMLPSRRARI